jgi:hypothetical protein
MTLVHLIVVHYLRQGLSRVRVTLGARGATEEPFEVQRARALLTILERAPGTTSSACATISDPLELGHEVAELQALLPFAAHSQLFPLLNLGMVVNLNLVVKLITSFLKHGDAHRAHWAYVFWSACIDFSSCDADPVVLHLDIVRQCIIHEATWAETPLFLSGCAFVVVFFFLLLEIRPSRHASVGFQMTNIKETWI